MIVRQYAPCSLGRSIICLGKQGEINALRVEFDVSAWMAMYPDATVKLMHFAPDRPQDNPVIPTLGVEGTLRVWIVGEEDTAGAGNGVIELLLIDERTGSTIKSATGYTTVLRSPSAGIEAQEPEPGYVRYDVDQSALLTDTQKAFARTNIDAIKDEKDPTVPDWAKQPSKPTYTASEVGALPSSYTPPVTSVNGKTGEVELNAQDVGARPDTWTPSADDVGADAAGTASGAVAAHNVSGAAHADLRALIEGLTSRLNTLADSDDTTLDQLSEIVAYIKSNKALIDAVTTGKVSVSDIVDNLTTNASGKVLSAAQGVALKAMIDGIVIPTALPNPQPITINGQRYDGSEAVTVTTVEIDDTLTQSGKAADAKAVGDQLSALNEANAKLKDDLDNNTRKGTILVDIDGTFAFDGYYRHQDDGKIVKVENQVDGYHAYEFPVEAGKCYEIYSYARFECPTGTEFYNDNPIGPFGEFDIDGTLNLKWHTTNYVCPVGVNKIIISGRYSTPLPYCKEIQDTFLTKYPLYGLKWVALGDSLTDSATLANYDEKTNYVDDVSNYLGLTTINLGKGGTGYVADNNCGQEFYTRVPSMPSDADIVTIFGSFNDSYRFTNYTLGALGDNTNDTLYGSIQYLIDAISTQCPNAVIGIILPTPCQGSSRRNNAEKSIEQINAIKDVAKYNSVPVLDLFDESNLRPWKSTFRDTYYREADGVHPNSKGHRKFISPKVKEFILNLVYHD